MLELTQPVEFLRTASIPDTFPTPVNPGFRSRLKWIHELNTPTKPHGIPCPSLDGGGVSPISPIAVRILCGRPLPHGSDFYLPVTCRAYRALLALLALLPPWPGLLIWPDGADRER